MKFFNTRQQPYFNDCWLGGLLGLCFFGLIFGSYILHPQYIAWLLQANNQDSAQHWIGWEFFRQESWHFPLGLIQHYGAPIATSIVYTDSIPLFALFFKLFQAYLPAHFQYFGYWYVLCCFLQGVFGWLIAKECSDNLLAKALITSFFLMSPIMLNRVVEHQALAAHWVLLAGLWLYIKPYQTRNSVFWLGLLTITILIHAYLALMVFILWGAYLIKMMSVTKQLSWQKASMQIASTLVVSLVVAWLAGYFVITLPYGIVAGGYVANAMNLLSPFIPSEGTWILPGHWSRFLKSFTAISLEQQLEGFNYFGLGMLSLMLVSGIAWIKVRRNYFIMSWLPILIVSIGLTAYALTYYLSLGTHVIAKFNVPAFFDTFCEIFRDAGRFFWPVYYLLMILVFKVLTRTKNTTFFITILFAGFLIQVCDLSLRFVQLRHYFAYPFALEQSEFSDPFWNDAPNRYKKIVFVPALNAPQLEVRNFHQILYYVATHNMAMNIGYFARQSYGDFIKTQRSVMNQLHTEKLAPDTIYIITSYEALMPIQARLTPADKVLRLGRYKVVAPNWFA